MSQQFRIVRNKLLIADHQYRYILIFSHCNSLDLQLATPFCFGGQAVRLLDTYKTLQHTYYIKQNVQTQMHGMLFDPSEGRYLRELEQILIWFNQFPLNTAH